jgi:uncharacterized membrane protein YraQ (UPF0718 family)
MMSAREDTAGAALAALPQRSSLGRDLAEAVQWAIIASGLMMLVLYPMYPAVVGEVYRVFLSIALEALPFMLIGSLAGGAIEVFVSRERLSGLLSRRPMRAVLIAAAMGLVFPVCQCAIVPVVRRLLRKGIPVAAAVAFLLGGPIVNPIVAGSTLVAYNYNWMILATRMGTGYAIAVGIGLLMSSLFKDNRTLLADGEHDADDRYCCNHHHDEHEHADAGEPAAPLLARLAEAARHAADDFMDIGRYLVIGALIVGGVQGLLGRNLFVSVASQPAVAIPAMMTLAFVLGLCSEADAFVAASFQGLVPLSGQIAFLLLGPVLNIRLVLMYGRLFRKRAIAVLAVSSVLAVFLAGLCCKLVTGK